MARKQLELAPSDRVEFREGVRLSSGPALSPTKQKWLVWTYDYLRIMRDEEQNKEKKAKLTNALAGLILVDSE